MEIHYNILLWIEQKMQAESNIIELKFMQAFSASKVSTIQGATSWRPVWGSICIFIQKDWHQHAYLADGHENFQLGLEGLPKHEFQDKVVACLSAFDPEISLSCIF